MTGPVCSGTGGPLCSGISGRMPPEYAVDETTGDLTYIWEGSDTRINGLTVSPNGNYLYNGSYVLPLLSDPETVGAQGEGTGGNATEVVQNAAGDNLLVTTEDNVTLAVYDLTDQAAPVLIDSLLLDPATTIEYIKAKSGFYQAVSADLSRFIVVGADSVATVAFDGTTLTLEDQIFDDEENTLDIVNRGALISPDGRYALVAFFTPNDADGNDQLDGGISTYEIAEDGTLTLLDTIDLDAVTRTVLAVPKP